MYYIIIKKSKLALTNYCDHRLKGFEQNKNKCSKVCRQYTEVLLFPRSLWVTKKGWKTALSLLILNKNPKFSKSLFNILNRLESSVADSVPSWPLNPGSWIGFFSGSRIPNPYFWELSDKNFLGKKFFENWHKLFSSAIRN